MPSQEGIFAQTGLPSQYKMKCVLGQGGMGMVMGAYDQLLDREVAIKVILQELDSDSHQRFLRESKALSLLDHPNIVKVFRSGVSEKGTPYYVMEYLQGESLQDRLRKQQRLSLQEFFQVFSGVLAGISYAHEAKITHRDLKPSNIILQPSSQGTEVKIIDFGIARIEGSEEGKTITKTNAVVGSPLYMSPEQCRGQRADALSDIYSIACIMYECLCGKAPYVGENALETMYKHINEDLPEIVPLSKSKGGERLSGLIRQCLQKSPAQRIQSARELNAMLHSISQESDLTTVHDVGNKNRLPYFIAFAVILVMGLAATSILNGRSNSSKVQLSANKSSANSNRQEANLRDTVRHLIGRIKLNKVTLRDSGPEERMDSIEAIITDLNKLGNTEMRLAAILDSEAANVVLQDAQKHLSEGLSYKSDAPGKRIILLCSRGRCWLNLNNPAKALADFDIALKEALEVWDEASGQWQDVAVQRIAAVTALKRYSEAEKCIDKIKNIWHSAGANPGKNMWVHTQFLDLEGDDRPDELAATLYQLKKTHPDSVDEIKQQARLTCKLAELFIQIGEFGKARDCLNLARELLSGLQQDREKEELLVRLASLRQSCHGD